MKKKKPYSSWTLRVFTLGKVGNGFLQRAGAILISSISEQNGAWSDIVPHCIPLGAGRKAPYAAQHLEIAARQGTVHPPPA